ncbi:hypothetical protein OG786_21030 [Streptomyces sp. NBC_00101]
MSNAATHRWAPSESMTALRRVLQIANTYCGACGWWVSGCPHQSGMNDR